VTDAATVSAAGYPASCPWCGQQRIHGVCPSASGDRHYRCVACGTTFFIHELPRRTAETSLPTIGPPPAKRPRRFFSRFARKR
jgi:transposase-like protein